MHVTRRRPRPSSYLSQILQTLYTRASHVPSRASAIAPKEQRWRVRDSANQDLTPLTLLLLGMTVRQAPDSATDLVERCSDRCEVSGSRSEGPAKRIKELEESSSDFVDDYEPPSDGSPSPGSRG